MRSSLLAAPVAGHKGSGPWWIVAPVAILIGAVMAWKIYNNWRSGK